MTYFKITGSLAAGLLALGGCVENTGSGSGASMASSASINTLATRGNLSPEAIRLQTMSMTLLSLEEEQQAARKRVTSFAVQGAALGAVAGGLAGALACSLQDCSDDQRNKAVAIGAVGGGALGANEGAKQAGRQNTAAARENALLRRLKVAGQQLTTARQARAQAQRVVVQNQRKLASVKAQVQAGQASKASLELARADAAADAKAVHAAVGAMDSSVDSVKDESLLNAQQNALRQEEKVTDQSYDALLASIKTSAL